MKKNHWINIIVCLVFLGLFLLQNVNAQDAVGKNSFGGIYKYGKPGNAYGILQVHPVSDTIMLFHLEVNRGQPSFASGELQGIITQINNKGIFRSSQDGLDCLLNFKFCRDSVTINTEKKQYQCGFGHGVKSDGIFIKTDNRIPETFYDRHGNLILFNSLK